MEQKNLSVLLISPLPPPAGGIATWTKQYLEWAQKRRLNVDLVNTSVIGKRANKINSNRSLNDEIVRTIKIIKILKNKIHQYRPDVVHLNSPCGKFGIIRDYLCAILVKSKKIKLIVHYRCNIEDQLNNSWFQMFFFRKLVRKATINLVLNNLSKEFIKSTTGKDGILVANFIDETFILNEPKIINPSIGNILFVGHVQKKKGVQEIIEVAKTFSNIKFTLVGPISSEIKEIGCPKNVIMLGPVDKNEITDLLRNSDLFLFPTYTEGFANALLEAMAMGLPTITTPVGANADMIESFGGIIVRKYNTRDIIDAINNLQDQEYRKKISIWNINKVKKSYLVDDVMESLISIYYKSLELKR